MIFNLLYFSVSTLHSSFLWRTDAIALAKLNKPPLSNMPPVSISPTSNVLRHLNFTFPLVTHAFSTTSLRVHFKLSLTPVEIFGFSILQDSVFSRSVTFLPRNKLFPSFKNSCLVLKRGNCKTCRVKMSLRQRSWGSSKLTYSSQVAVLATPVRVAECSKSFSPNPDGRIRGNSLQRSDHKWI